MADNFFSDNSGNILVEFDYNNIIVVDPNKTIDGQGNIQERLVDHENLVMFVNLEAEVLPRTKLAVGGSPQDVATTISVAKINFLAPNKDNYFSTQYYDELTGNNANNGTGQNQITETLQSNPNQKRSYIKTSVVTNGVDGSLENGLLGITSINVRLGTSFVPSVDVELEDVQGRALFQLGDNSPYAAFFNLPYPPFYLTIKGYYGQAVRYQLNLQKFNARFNSFSGNYQVSLKFLGYKFNILNEIEMGSLFATPHMYATRYDVSSSSNPQINTSVNVQSTGTAPILNSNDTQLNVESVVTEKGYEKILEVYSEYKAKGLLSPDFPELTLAQFMNKIDLFETNVLETYPKTNVQPLTDCRTFKNTLKQYYGKVYQDSNSWFNKWMNPKPLIGNQNQMYYVFKDFTPAEKTDAQAELKSIINNYRKKLDESGVLGSGGRATIKNSIEITDIILNNFNFLANINEQKTIESITGIVRPNPDSQAFIKAKEIISQLYKVTFVGDQTNTQSVQSISKDNFLLEPIFRFDLFTEKIQIMEAEANRKLGEFETLITEDLARKLEDDRIGIGFLPTVRNVSAIIMASAEGFIRLMDEVHTNAWNKKDDDTRRRIILQNPSSANSPDVKNLVPKAPSEQATQSQIPVYPWPQFFVETPDDKKGRFQLRYLADPSVVPYTLGTRYDIWPEVEFVEEYLKGLTQKFDPPIAQPPSNTSAITNLININAIEFPQNNLAYRNKEEIKFFYEIYERQFVTSHYTGLSRIKDDNPFLTTLLNSLRDYESQNIVNSLGVSSPSLTFNLKNENYNSLNYVEKLREFSNNGTGRSYQDFIRDFFVTPYLRTLTDKSFSILNLDNEGAIPQNNLANVATQIQEVLNTAPNSTTVMDIYPFTDETWTSKNMVQINQYQNGLVFNTNKTLTVYKPRNVISNFSVMTDYISARPVTNFNYTLPIQSLLNSTSFDYRRSASQLIPTEGYVRTIVPSIDNLSIPQIPELTTTSIFNTPFFINAISEGVSNNKKNGKYPYKSAAYLFLNSLPLISLRELLKTKGENNSYVDKDYMFATLKKFGAVHKLPYAWMLKIGSIWHRYKTYKQSNVDILSGVWGNFNYINSYDPITNNPSKIYSYIDSSGQKQEIQLANTVNNVSTTNVGFYPKLINDFNYFYNGFDLFEDYTDDELQNAVQVKGLKIFNITNSNITNVRSGNNTFNLKTWSIMVSVEDTYVDVRDCKKTIKTTTSNLFVVPSFGSTLNQSRTALVYNSQMASGQSFSSNPSVFNGSCRLFWKSPNYGYFDTTLARKPEPDEYMNQIRQEINELSPFRFLGEGHQYSKIDDIFSVFDKKILDLFEEEFLNFCKPLTDIEIGPKTVVSYNGVRANQDDVFRNFQYLMRNMMKVPPQGQQSLQDVFLNNIENQADVLQNQIASFLTYDVLFRYGNPSNYNERVFNSFLSRNMTFPIVVDPIQFEPYEKNSLPSSSGGITLAQSKQIYKAAWKELELQIGFSTIEQLRYKDSGSYITDFFIDNNIKFTVDNITILSAIIKIYATQKLKNPTITQSQFDNLLNQNEVVAKSLQDKILNGVMAKVSKDLPNLDQVIQTTNQTVVDGQQSKVETYEKFKALNDKWIAGGDFINKTFFEDILFLDRASRNIGNTLLVDVFELKKVLNKRTSESSLKMSVYTFLAGLLINNNFVIMNLPSYVNFYNVQDVDGVDIRKPEGTLDFANNLWGTFLSVDYRNSGPKMVCFFTGKPSQYLDLPDNKYYGYRNDGFDMRRLSEVPLIEDINKKTDYAISNRCVGFNVDIGVRNQNIFYSFTVGQDNGKATSESINTVYNMSNQAAGVNTATQNVGLYNLYKQRSYPCTVTALGNAMIQPTMYFNLRHVPMFNGPYLIQDVVHSISPGNFQTQFTGIRQGMFDLPQIDQYLQSINRNLLTKLEAIVKNRKEEVASIAITNEQKAANTQSNANNSPSTENACVANTSYLNEGFESVKTIDTTINPQAMYDEIVKVIKQNSPTASLDNQMIKIMYSICYVTNYKDNVFNGYSNNYSTLINLQNNFSPTYKTANGIQYFNKKYSCIEGSDKKPIPVANFDTLNDFVSFLYARLKPNQKLITKQGLWKYYCCDYPTVGYVSKSTFESTKLTSDTYKNVLERLTAGVESLRKLGMDITDINELLNGTTTTTSSSQAAKLKCDPPTIIDFNPKSAFTEDTSPQITITGTFLYGKTQVFLNGKVGTIESNTDTEIVFVPKDKVTGKIKVKTEYGNPAETTQDFVFLTKK
jgi:hypothetical protein